MALQNYQSTFRVWPYGAINRTLPWGGPRITWAIQIYPFLEETNVFDRFDFTLSPAGYVFANNANSTGSTSATAIAISTLLCPSDGLGPSSKPSVWGTFAKSNYLAFFGNIDYASACPPTAVGHLAAAFAINHATRLAEITDGTSHTLALGEYLVGADGESDFRGGYWSDQPAYGQIYTALGPNSPSPDVIYPSEGTYPTYCFDLPQMNLPCVSSTNFSGVGHTAAARSRHAGIVNVLLVDGSVQAISDDISLPVWQALGSIHGGEIASAN